MSSSESNCLTECSNALVVKNKLYHLLLISVLFFFKICMLMKRLLDSIILLLQKWNNHINCQIDLEIMELDT